MMTYLTFLILILIICKVSSDTQERQLIERLFSTYDNKVRPIKKNSTTVQVSVDYWFVSLLDIQERGQQLSAFGWMQMVWEDEFFKWDLNEFNLTYVVVNAKDIWYPDLVIRNSADSIYGDIFDNNKYRVPIYNDGSVYFYTAGQTKTFCRLDMTYFPFDVQSCYIHVDSWTYSVTQVRLNTTEGIKLNLYNPNGQWSLIKTRYKLSQEEFNGDIYSDLKFMIYLKRKPLYFMTNLIIPCCLMSVIVLFVFLLPASADEKVSLSITVLLSFSVFQLLVAGSMPETSDYIPLITVYITFVMFLSAMSLFSTIIVLMIHHHDTQSPPPRWLKKLALEWLVFFLCSRSKLVPCCGCKRRKDEEGEVQIVLPEELPSGEKLEDLLKKGDERSIEELIKYSTDEGMKNVQRKFPELTEKDNKFQLNVKGREIGSDNRAYDKSSSYSNADTIDNNSNNVDDTNNINNLDNHDNSNSTKNAVILCNPKNKDLPKGKPTHSKNKSKRNVLQSNITTTTTVTTTTINDNDDDDDDDDDDENNDDVYDQTNDNIKRKNVRSHCQHRGVKDGSVVITKSLKQEINRIKKDNNLKGHEVQTQVDIEVVPSPWNSTFTEKNPREKRTLYSKIKNNEIDHEFKYYNQDYSNNNNNNCNTIFQSSESYDDKKVLKQHSTTSDTSQQNSINSKSPKLSYEQQSLDPTEKKEKFQMSSIFQLVTASLARINSEKRSEEIKKQWAEIACVFDRLFLVLFSLATMLVAVALLGVLPQFGPKIVEPIAVS